LDLHVFPRYAGDGFTIAVQWKESERSLLDAEAKAIQRAFTWAQRPPRALSCRGHGGHYAAV
jgi:diadenosine tetraphosphate (Ap4A) HIT family hydrolase